jgi:hypothetical protein
MLFSNALAGPGPQEHALAHGCSSQAPKLAQRTHVVHALVVGFHAVCCGAPVVLMGLGAASGLGWLAGAAFDLHGRLHGAEGWILGLSAVLVALGGVLEWRLRQRGSRRFPWAFAASVAALMVNAAIIGAHLGPSGSHLAAHQTAAHSGHSH